MRLDAEQLQERNRLESLVKLGRIYCEKHQRLLTVVEFWRKKCYIGREGHPCDYITLAKVEGRVGSHKESSPFPKGENGSI